MSRWLNDVERAWCPGCGNYKILDAFAAALDELELKPEQVAIVAGIGQAGKLAHYLNGNFLHGLHGRTLAQALGVRLANPALTVIAVGGDGDIYGEGGNHLVHAFRRNADIACIVHNNGVYGLTRGQPSPTGPQGLKSRFAPQGTPAPPFNPLAAALGAGATFVARGFAGDTAQLTRLIVAAVRHPGFGFVDVLQPCVTYNRLNTWKWYGERVYDIASEEHDLEKLEEALPVALEWPGGKEERIPTGIIYRVERPVYETAFPALKPGAPGPAVPDPERLRAAAREFR